MNALSARVHLANPSRIPIQSRGFYLWLLSNNPSDVQTGTLAYLETLWQEGELVVEEQLLTELLAIYTFWRIK